MKKKTFNKMTISDLVMAARKMNCTISFRLVKSDPKLLKACEKARKK